MTLCSVEMLMPEIDAERVEGTDVGLHQCTNVAVLANWIVVTK